MTGVSTLGQVLDQIELLKGQQRQLGDLQTQLATGKKTQRFSGLGNGVLVSQRVRSNFESFDSFIGNIDNASRRIDLAVGAVTEFQAQTRNFLNFLDNFSQESTHQEGDIIFFDDPATPDVNENTQIGMTSATSDVDFETLQQMAQDVLPFLTDLLNRQDQDRFLFAGAETGTRPIGDTSTLNAAIGSLVDDWKNNNITTDELISGLGSRDPSADPNAISDSLIGYSASLSSGNTKNVFVRVDDNSEIDMTVLANEQAFRDVIVGVSYFASADLPPIADQLDPDTLAVIEQGAPGADIQEMKDNFYAVFNSLRSTITSALDRMDQSAFKLENAKARAQTIKISHQHEKNVLLGTISEIEDADINDVAVKLNTLQIQLEASFAVTSRVQALSLVNFI